MIAMLVSKSYKRQAVCEEILTGEVGQLVLVYIKPTISSFLV
jgi:hypothetical protein